MIGDKPRDIEAAQAVGIRGILIAANTPMDTVLNNAEI